MEQKPFAIGVRVEHPQEKINKSQYGFSDNRLGAQATNLHIKRTTDVEFTLSVCVPEDLL